MLQVDILTSYVISGAGALVAAAMTALARPDERHLVDAVRICCAGFLVLGAGLFQLVFDISGPGDPRMFVALASTSICVGLFAWGLARLSNERVRPGWALATLGGALAVLLGARALGGWAFDYAFLGVTAALSLLAVVAQRGVILRPANAAERVLGLVVIGFVVSWLARGVLTLGYDGPELTHHMNVPVAAMPLFATLYGVMPIFIATLILNVINARLAQRLATLALTDELTGLMTRRALRELAPATIGQARYSHQEVAVLMLDLDHFKAVNDRHGHLVGDDVLRRTAAAVRSQLRPDALLTRFGGEEFAAVVPVSDLATARQMAERVRRTVAEAPAAGGTAAPAVTASIGLTMLRPAETLDAAILRADEALFRAKRAGRDRVESSLGVAA
jgi:diguanylate cyclase (GGDEF)-like protein